MADVAELLRRPSVSSHVRPLAPVPEASRVDHVRVIEQLGDLERVTAGAFVVLTASATAATRDYQLDGAVRAVATRGAGALVLTSADIQSLPRTTAAIADDVGLALLRTSPESLDAAVLHVDRELRGDAAVALRRIEEVMAAVAEWSSTHVDVDLMLSAASAALDAEVKITDHEPDVGLSQPIDVEGAPPAWVVIRDDAADGPTAAHYAIQLLAAALRERAYDQARRSDAPVQSRADVLTEILLTDQANAAVLLERARAMGIPVDGWHSVVRVEIENFDELTGLDDVAAYDLGITAARLATDVLGELGGAWSRAGMGSSSLLVRTTRRPPHSALEHLGPTRTIAVRYIDRLLSRVPDAVLRCGIGTPQAGPAGLKASAAEARAAVAAATARGVANAPVAFDAAGIRKVLLDWYASDTARDAVDQLVLPLRSLEKSRRDDYLHTLKVFLDTGESLTQTAEALHVHRNTVKYRLDRLLEMLDIDRSDPDHRLLLHLACRAYFLGS